LALIGFVIGSTASTAEWLMGMMKQKGSPFLNWIIPGRVNRQFMVNGKGSQKVSTMPISG